MLKPDGFFYSFTAHPDRNDALTATGSVRKMDEDEIAAQMYNAGFRTVHFMRAAVMEGGREVVDWEITATKAQATTT